MYICKYLEVSLVRQRQSFQQNTSKYAAYNMPVTCIASNLHGTNFPLCSSYQFAKQFSNRLLHECAFIQRKTSYYFFCSTQGGSWIEATFLHYCNRVHLLKNLISYLPYLLIVNRTLSVYKDILISKKIFTTENLHL